MRFASITLIGFIFTALCASMCPMNMGAMQMDHSIHAMHTQGDQENAPCEHCEENESEEAVLSDANTPISGLFAKLNFSPSALFEPISRFDYELTGLSQITESRPPPLASFITNKVVLRT